VLVKPEQIHFHTKIIHSFALLINLFRLLIIDGLHVWSLFRSLHFDSSRQLWNLDFSFKCYYSLLEACSKSSLLSGGRLHTERGCLLHYSASETDSIRTIERLFGINETICPLWRYRYIYYDVLISEATSCGITCTTGRTVAA
jgi:hypothetical protein